MDYYCNNCNSNFKCDIEVKYCPFCGQSYHEEDRKAKPNTLRIVIGSDSERTIENKYWAAARESITQIQNEIQSQVHDLWNKSMRRLGYIPIPEEFGEFISNGESEPPVRIRNYIKRIERTFEEIEKHPEQLIIRATQVQDWIDKERAIIINTNKKVMELLGNEETINYENRHNSRSNKDFDEDSIRLNRYDHLKYILLLQAIHYAEGKIWKIIFDEDSSFNKPYAKSLSIEEAEEYDPDTLSKELTELAELDYDFIFGESPDQFILKFWDCIIYLAHIANEMLDDQYVKTCATIKISKEKIGCEIATLAEIASDFSKSMEINLDNLYRSQNADMLDLQLSLKKLLEECTADGNL